MSKQESLGLLTIVIFLVPVSFVMHTHQNEIIQSCGLGSSIFAGIFSLILIGHGLVALYRLTFPKKIDPQKGVWPASTGPVRLCDMGDDHLAKAILYVQRKAAYGGSEHELYQSMLLEVERRKRISKRVKKVSGRPALRRVGS